MECMITMAMDNVEVLTKDTGGAMWTILAGVQTGGGQGGPGGHTGHVLGRGVHHQICIAEVRLNIGTVQEVL